MKSKIQLILFSAFSLVSALALAGGQQVQAYDPSHLLILKNTGNCENCDLSGADLSNIKLTNANLKGSNLANANLENAAIIDSDLRSVNFSGAVIKNTNVYGTQIAVSSLSKSQYDGLVFEQPELEIVEIDATAPRRTSSSRKPDQTYEVRIDCYYRGLDYTGTKDRITVQFWSGDKRVGSRYSDGISDDRPTAPCRALGSDPAFAFVTGEPISHVVVKTDGTDAFFIDELRIYRNGTEVKWHGRDQGRGWCISKDPTDNTRSWAGKAGECQERQKFSL